MDKTQRAKELVAAANAAMDAVQTYTSTVVIQERIHGKDRKTERILYRFARPGSTYMRWLKGPYEGLQLSRVPDRDGPGKLQAREAGLKGLVGVVSWPIDSPIAQKLYPHHFSLDETGVLFLVNLTATIQAKAEKLGKFQVLSIDELDDPFLHRKATRVVSQLSSDPADGLRWPKTELFCDSETSLPLHFKLHDFDGGLFGEYAFTEFEPNAKLAADAFELPKL